MEIDWLPTRTILLTLAGSRAYGTATATSDVDMKGVAVPPREYFYGFLYRFEQADSPVHMASFKHLLSPDLQAVVDRTKLEGTVFDIRKFISLAADCNPNILDVLFCADEDVVVTTPAGDLLRASRDQFLSKVAKHRFSGYALSQLKRIQTHRKWLIDPPTEPPKRSDFGLDEATEIPKAQLQAVNAAVQKQLDRWNEGFVSDLEESAKIRVREGVSQLLSELKIASEDRFTLAARSMAMEENFIHYLQRERNYATARQHWDQYVQWRNTRNEDRAKLEAQYGYDVKHAMHLVRLLRMCREILTEGRVIVKRHDAKELLEVRNGMWTYDRLMTWAEREDQELTELMATSALPPHPSRKALDRLCCDLVAMYNDR